MHKILLVEDDLISAEALKIELENLGYQIIDVVDDYDGAIAAASSSFVDCAVVDIDLHGSYAGIEIAKQIRQIGNCPIVFLSSYNHTQLLMQAAATMPYGYLNKPYRLVDLHTTITIAIQRHRLEILERQMTIQQQEFCRLVIQRDSTLFHDLKTPLATVMLALAQFENHPKVDLIKRSTQRALEIINQSQLTEQVDDLALPALEQFCLIKYANSLIQEILIISEYKCPITLICEFDSLMVEVQKSYLWQILTNLIQNAVKYSLPGKPIEVVVARQGKQVLLEVSDQGIGIPLDSLDQVFNFRYRAPNLGEIAGDGVGLYAVKQAVECLHGEISVSSVVGQGSLFAVSLPILI